MSRQECGDRIKWSHKSLQGLICDKEREFFIRPSRRPWPLYAKQLCMRNAESSSVDISAFKSQ